MRFLADESCDFSIVRGLRASGHDVLAVSDVLRGAPDESVIELALAEKRLLLTEDKDFGQLVFAASANASGVILIRFPQSSRSALLQVVLDLIRERGDSLHGCFVVVVPGRLRISRLPDWPPGVA